MTKSKSAFLIPVYAFLIPAFALLSICYIKEFSPFGDKSLLIMDMSEQYIEFFNALKHGDVFFSWSKSLGTNYIGVFAYYVSSPFSILTLLFSETNMPIAMLVLTVLKIGLSGFTFSIFLSYRFKTSNIGTVIFSASYALMSYNIAYSMCVMWLDGVLWLPIILIGAERIIEENRWKIFCFSMCVCLVSTYYISYMIILFSCIYFIVRSIEESVSGTRLLRNCITFAKSGLISAGIGAFFLLPTFLSHFDGKLASAQVDYSSNLNFEISGFISKLFMGGYDSLTNSGTPYIYCGIITLIFACIFFFNRAFTVRSKLCHGFMLILLFFSMWICSLDKIWHVFQYPNWFPYRYSFLFSFVLIYTAYGAFAHTKIQKSNAASMIILLAMAVNLSYNAISIFDGLDSQFGYKSLSEYAEFRENKSVLLSAIEDDTDFYRVGSNMDRSKNDALGFGYNGVTHYSSSYLYSVNNWIKSFGLAQSYFWSGYYGSTVLTDTFLGVKYVISNTEPASCYEMVRESDVSGIYLNPFYSSVAFGVSEDIYSMAYASSPFENQNNLFSGITGIEGAAFKTLATEETSSEHSTEITFTSSGGLIYGYFTPSSGNPALYVNGEFVTYLFTSETDCIQYLGSYPVGEIATLTIASGTPITNYELCFLDLDIFSQGVEQLETNALNINEVKDSGHLSGQVYASENGYVLTSIPAADGWAIFVDDMEVDYEILLDTFIVIPVSQGEHEIALSYTAPGLRLGLIITGITVLALAYRACVKRGSKGNQHSRIMMPFPFEA